MPLTSPKNYYWVGGSTGTTSASRFDWNVASNWRVLKNTYGGLSETNLIPATMPPVGGDYVSVGYGKWTPGTTSNNRINSPLLFGGFSGSGGTGCWICDGTTGSTFAGASGTTFNTSVTYVTVRPDYLNAFVTGVFGCGLTGEVGPTDVKDILVSMNVSGMDSGSWRYLSDNATTRQSSLNVKTRILDVEGDNTSSYPSPHYIKPNIIDSYSALSGTTGVINTYFRYFGNKRDVFLQLSGAKLASCLINRTGGEFGGFVYITDSYIGSYNDTFGNISTSVNQNSFIGTFLVTIGDTVQSGSFNATYELAGTFKNKDTWKYQFHNQKN